MSADDVRVAVIGAGPSGIFAAEALAAKVPGARIDVLDRGLSPYGLVRYGVAPDHHKIKSVTRVLAKTLTRPQVRYLGHVRVGDAASGADVELAELRRRYHAVIVATGAPHGIRLGVPGDDLAGSLTAGEMVPWYNGHPDAAPPPAPGRSVVVVGAGNVALDVARVLLKGSPGLAETDVPARVHERLRSLATTDVHLVIRRGPSEVRFGLPELRGMDRLDGVAFHVDPADFTGPAGDDGPGDGAARVLRSWTTRADPAAPRRLHLHFRRTVRRIHGEGRVRGVELTPTGQAGPVGALPADLVIAAIGYRSEPLPGVAFDPVTGRIPNTDGRVGVLGDGCYVVGWAKRGPQGVIGTNKVDAAATITTVLGDLDALRARTVERDDLLDVLRRRGVPVLTWDHWQRLDAAETAQGAHRGRARIKIDKPQMLAIMSETTPCDDSSAGVGAPMSLSA